MRRDISQAALRVKEHVRKTPVMDVTLGGFDLQLKLEHLQHSGTFKARGAFNNLLSREVPDAGVVAASGGNHGAAVAFAATRLGIPARVYVPEIAGTTKIGLIKSTGADCFVVPGAYADALDAALAYEAETGAMQLHAYDGLGTVAGQGTLFGEWEDQGLDADTVLIAVGGGGLIGGALGWFEGRRKVVGVEPVLAPTLNSALVEDGPTDVNVAGVAANALGARRIGSVCYDLAAQHLGASVLVPDDAIIEAQKLLWKEIRLLVEPAGAAAMAALLCGAYVPGKDEKLAVLLCGGNVAKDPLS